MGVKPRAAVLTLGCKVNQFDSAAMAESLRAAGYEVAAGPSGADLVVLNTCTVTQKADQEALSLIRRLRRLAPAARLVVTGCLAEADPELLTAAGQVDLVLGQADKSRLASLLEGSKGSPGGTASLGKGLEAAADFTAPLSERTRAFYKIQDGCSAGCAYCAVPRARGPSRSLGLEAVLAGLRSYLERGVAEVALCGIHLGCWGRDLDQPYTLAELLHVLAAELEPDAAFFLLCLSSLEPLEADDELLAAFEMYDWLAPHFHLPLQSGSDRVLELMGRPYRAADFRRLVEKLNRAWPLAAVGTDVMAGFPGETDSDFQATLDLLANLSVSYFHIFPYSPRPGTPAAARPDQVPEHIKRRRAVELKKADQLARLDFARRNWGTVQAGLVENRPHPASGRLKVLTGNYLTALLPPGLKVPPLIPVTLSPPDNPWGLMEAEPAPGL
ncbi:MAG: tRNA (N(6)-L-threonylcarbamoyladenosine(37)-C(2))-methylthiotransferase MtaB [Candidatus Adiutrix sp.]|jgi:threonylcarbamoyladenosine tRNA methylthiotransferase MtaB|nr:tRNA (N(6)-L-threonylcarbamoyladenosine(37)-C(2))-methylthiotransferase MtaB [Candidatus Adiutrix sp.]